MTQANTVPLAPELTAEEQNSLERMESAFLVHVLAAYTAEQNNEDWTKLPPDMQLQAFLQGTLSGLASSLLIAFGAHRRQLVIDNITKSIPYAVELAEYKLAQDERRGATTQ